MALVHNCNDNIVVAVFVSWLQVIHSFYKHLVKHEVTKMRDILSRAQKYIQIKNATWSAVDRSTRWEDKGEKPKPQPAFLKKNQNRAFGAVHKQTPPNPAKSYGEKADFSPFKISMDLFSTPSSTKLGEALEANAA